MNNKRNNQNKKLLETTNDVKDSEKIRDFDCFINLFF